MRSWDPDKYEKWFDTEHGQYALEQKNHLLQRTASGWARRDRTLLEIGCGTGLALQHLYEMGFDVTGLDRSPEMVMAARSRFGCRAEICVGNGEHTSFNDDQFDYVVLWSVLEFSEYPEELMTEALRVAKKGILIGAWNTWSLHHYRDTPNLEGCDANPHWQSWARTRFFLQKHIGMLPASKGAILFGPQSTWNKNSWWDHINKRILPPPLGAFCAVRFDFEKRKGVTPLFVWRKTPAFSQK